ncbi:MAG: cryptochrome/photolyase family protein, partial [Prochlorococcaceae cyanobacterium]
MSIGIWILGDQLSQQQAALLSLEQQLGAQQARQHCRVLLIESTAVVAWRAYHRQKLVLVWSAMRHFAAELARAGWQVDYREASSFSEVLRGWSAEHAISELHVMEPAERPFREAITRLWQSEHLPPLIWHDSNAFLWSREDFAAWARPYKQLRMELFYREGRRR